MRSGRRWTRELGRDEREQLPHLPLGHDRVAGGDDLGGRLRAAFDREREHVNALRPKSCGRFEHGDVREVVAEDEHETRVEALDEGGDGGVLARARGQNLQYEPPRLEAEARGKIRERSPEGRGEGGVGAVVEGNGTRLPLDAQGRALEAHPRRPA